MIFSVKLIEEYQHLKSTVPDCVLLMQVGAFMQVLEEDARKVSEITGLKLKIGGDVDDPRVGGGFPKTGLNDYVGQLVRHGHSVALAFQDEQKRRLIREIIRLRAEGNVAKNTGP
ncbi:MAG: hypothetical protein HQM12_24255 [SAR324 cluster bacterium]|nr:hypothetical protein [SAR324 cluster bacterium]